MQNFNIKPIYILAVILMVTAGLSGCYKDKGNYDYQPLPPGISIDTNTYGTSYQKKLNIDSLIIDPVISYDGDTSKLRYEWQIWKNLKYTKLQSGRKLRYKVGKDDFIPSIGSYSIRLAVSNKELASDEVNPNANMVFSRIITLSVLTEAYQGMLVLHGDGNQCDVGLIQDNFFLPKGGQTVKTAVISDFYSSFNGGEKIPGIGKQLEKIGLVTLSGSTVTGSSNIYIFTDKTTVRADYLIMQKKGDYSFLFKIPSVASGKPGSMKSIAEGQNKSLVDDGRLFYGTFVGPLFNPDIKYYAAPYVAVIAWSPDKRGAVIFDNISKSFLYCPYNTSTSSIDRFPANAVSGVNLQPNNMNADLVYMEARGRRYNTLAVMKDQPTGNKYLAEFDFTAEDLGRVSVGRYPMENLPDQDKIKHYAFGRELNMAYYATSNKLYQYLFQGGNLAAQAYAFPANEEITMMKIIKYEFSPSSTYYQFSNKQMLISTVDSQGHGKIYAFAINEISGAISLKGTFDGFGRVYDVCVKDQ